MYRTLRYNSKERWLSYWYQISESISLNPESLLIIGKGSGVVESTIASISPEINITTFDLSAELLPDVIGDMRRMPFSDLSFDCMLCCQVLEHIPFGEVRSVLKEFHRITRRFLIISLPHKRKHIKLEIDTPLTGRRVSILKYPFMKKMPGKSFDAGDHCWEINRGVSYRQVKRVLSELFVIGKSFLNEMNCTHRFFVLEKTE
jgi:ubiquinone/menaquinone biosynthesis C-methylase UbiE